MPSTTSTPQPTLTDGQLAQVRADLIEHAAKAHPAECCGLIVRVPQCWGAEFTVAYIEARNEFSGTPGERDRFRIHHEDWAAAEDLGQVLAVVHSHPDACANPSMADRVMCERTGLTWVIVGYPSQAVTVTHPTGFEAPLIGRQFHHGILDCYTLIRDYYARTLSIELPDFEREDGWWEETGDGHRNLYRDGYEKAGFILVNDMPREHDVLLMQVAARCDNHAAVFLGDGTILHHLYGRLSGREVYGGTWERHTTAVLRHKSLLDVAAAPAPAGA